MLIEIDIYKSDFEPEFLKFSENYYKIESEKLLEKFEIKSYLQHVKRRIEEETSRIKNMLEKSTARQLLGILD